MTEIAKEALSEAKKKRRSAKSSVTRAGNGLVYLLENNRPVPEVQESLAKLETLYGTLQEKHELFTELIDGDEEFATEEAWMDDCQNNFMHLRVRARDYLDAKLQGQCTENDNADGNEPNSETELTSKELTAVHDEVQPPEALPPSDSGPPPQGQGQESQSQNANMQSASNTQAACNFKMEKPKLPRFSGDVREYTVFKEDFKHAVESRYSKRDAMTYLRACLQGKPLELVRGIGTDYEAAWQYLDSIYGDPRFVSDQVTQDLAKFRPLKDGEDSRFCDLVHLVKRSYNTMKGVGRPYDMDNNHMISLIEQKMCIEDRKVWARELEKEKTPASLQRLMSWMEAEMKSRMRATAPLRNSSQNSRYVNQFSGGKLPKCWVCESSSHWVDQCEKFKALSPNERLKTVKENHACFSCLKKAGRDHRAANCSRRKQCTQKSSGVQCKYFHHVLLHTASPPAAVGVATMAEGSEALLPIITAKISGRNNQHKNGNILFDSGAQVSLISTNTAKTLQLTGKNVSTTIKKVGGEEEVLETKVYRVPVTSLGSGGKFTINAIGIPYISDDIAKIDVKSMVEGIGLSETNIYREGGPIDLLIGIDYAYMHTGDTKRVDNIVVRHSPLGWVMFGAAPSLQQTCKVFHVQYTKPVDLTDFWTSETMGVGVQSYSEDPKLSKIEIEETKAIERGCKLVNNRWVMAYPWKTDPKDLPDNREQAVKKLEATERRLQESPENAAAYREQMREMEDLGFARKLTEKEIEEYKGPVHYIAHREVVRPDKKSTPVRIVFNSSSRYKGHCLNECWMKGPDLLNDMFGVILRFREQPVAVSGDISKMYHRIGIPEEDQQVHRFVWRDMDTSRPPDTYIKTVLTFGDKPAPAMAQIALRKTADLEESLHPYAAEVLKKNTYMDDICDSVPTVQRAQQLTEDIDNILEKGGFKVKEWLSNEKLHDVQPEEKSTVKFLESKSEEKVLGVAWNNKKDIFTFKVKADEPPVQAKGSTNDVKLTKRKILSKVARVFDPIGFAAAFLILAKIGLQRLWQQGFTWDEELPAEVSNWWIDFFAEIRDLNDISFPRSLTPLNTIGLPTLCIFADASRNAFGTCAYLRWEKSSGSYESRFISAKSRVAPLKELTIPRLELQAAVLASRLYKTIVEECRLEFEKVIFFTDSMIVLTWIRSQSRVFKPFVSSRITEIQTNCDPSTWRHIPSEHNAADELSRGISAKKLQERWKNGPEFLSHREEEWPAEQPEPINAEELNKERRKQDAVFTVTNVPIAIDHTKFSNWKKLVRVTAWILRYVRNLRYRRKPKDEIDPLIAQELEEAEKLWIKTAQKELHKRIKNKEFNMLSPFVDEAGMIRVGGRVGKAVVTYDSKHPLLLPKNHYISYLITKEVHETGHTGVAATAAKTRRRFWIIGVQRLAKSIKRKCVNCHKADPKTESQFMAELPTVRLMPQTPPFYNTACDYFGPYNVKVGRNKTTKHYGVLFTCLNTRAVHLELATDYSTMELIQVLRRFFAIRGYPALMLSDNGSQLVGAENELARMIKGWDVKKLKEYAAEKRMEWKFITPKAPHQNGCAESLVKSCKIALKRAMGDTVLTPFELYTVLLEIANLVNQRPIGRPTNDPDDGAYLCPNDLLLERASSHVPQGPFLETKNPRHRVEFLQQILDSFWRRWTRDVFPSLVPRKKWDVQRRNVQVNDIIMMVDSNAVRGNWTIGRITEVHPGKDGKVRNVTVKTQAGQYRRPITKIAVIHPADGE